MCRMAKVGVFALLLIVAFGGSALAGKGKKGKNGKDRLPSPYDAAFDFILEHDAELKITPDQVAKLEAVQESYGKYCQDPAVQAAVKDLRHARKTGTPQDVEAANRKISAQLKEKSGGILDGLQTDLGKILSGDQMKKYVDMRTKSAATQPDADTAKALVPFGL